MCNEAGPRAAARLPARARRLLLLLAMQSLASAAADAEPEVAASVRAAIAGLSPRDVGARYGQAQGAVEICSGAKTTDMASALPSIYEGDDLIAFKSQAARIYEAWMKVKNCASLDDPNQCRMIVDESCAAAFAEIGPSGTALPGLLERRP